MLGCYTPFIIANQVIIILWYCYYFMEFVMNGNISGDCWRGCCWSIFFLIVVELDYVMHSFLMWDRQYHGLSNWHETFEFLQINWKIDSYLSEYHSVTFTSSLAIYNIYNCFIRVLIAICIYNLYIIYKFPNNREQQRRSMYWFVPCNKWVSVNLKVDIV